MMCPDIYIFFSLSLSLSLILFCLNVTLGKAGIFATCNFHLQVFQASLKILNSRLGLLTDSSLAILVQYSTLSSYVRISLDLFVFFFSRGFMY